MHKSPRDGAFVRHCHLATHLFFRWGGGAHRCVSPARVWQPRQQHTEPVLACACVRASVKQMERGAARIASDKQTREGGRLGDERRRGGWARGGGHAHVPSRLTSTQPFHRCGPPPSKKEEEEDAGVTRKIKARPLRDTLMSAKKQGMGGPLVGFWLHLSFKMRTHLSEQKKTWL